MAVGKIPINATYVPVSAVTTEQLKKAKIVIATYVTSDNTTRSTVALIPEYETKDLSAVWNGERWFFSYISLLWSKSSGTVTIISSYSERPNATLSVGGYYLIF